MAAWLNSIARNVVLTHLRTKRSATKHMQLYREWLAERLFDEAQGSDHDYAERCQKALAECMKELSANGRKILELRYAHNMSHRMISEALGRTADAVAKSLSRIREALRNCIRERLLVA
ncbi:MAG: sigma-70 family RNA polymerase sigma factor [Kiritimatiellia bacterium]